MAECWEVEEKGLHRGEVSLTAGGPVGRAKLVVGSSPFVSGGVAGLARFGR